MSCVLQEKKKNKKNLPMFINHVSCFSLLSSGGGMGKWCELTNDPSAINPSAADNRQTVVSCNHQMLSAGLNPPVTGKAPLICILFLFVMKALKLKLKSTARSSRTLSLLFQSGGHLASLFPKPPAFIFQVCDWPIKSNMPLKPDLHTRGIGAKRKWACFCNSEIHSVGKSPFPSKAKLPLRWIFPFALSQTMALHEKFSLSHFGGEGVFINITTASKQEGRQQKNIRLLEMCCWVVVVFFCLHESKNAATCNC